MDAVNLLPLEHKIRAKKRATPAGNLDSRRTLRTGGLAAVALVLLLGALYGYERSVVNSKKSALAKDQNALAQIKPQADAIKAAQAASAARLAVISSVSSSRMNWDKALNDFARIVPTDSFITSLSFDAPVQTASLVGPPPTTTSTTTDTTTDPSATTPVAPVTSGSTLTVAGTAPGTVGVARVLDRFALVPWLSGVTLASASRSGDNGGDSFNITATVSQEH
jgi:Tfp pilus assembly protein PilN